MEQRANIKGYDVRIYETMQDLKFSYFQIGEVLKLLASKFVFQLEEGESKIPHFQIRLNLMNKMRAAPLLKLIFKSLNITDKKAFIHISPTSLGVHKHKNFNYVMKLDGRIAGPWADTDFNNDENKFVIDELIGINESHLRPFQKSLLEMSKIKDRRCIDYIFDEKGNNGKGFFSDYMELHEGAYVLPSIDDYKLIIQDVHNVVSDRIKKYGSAKRDIKLFILDMPRIFDSNHMSNMIGAIETIKGGRVKDFRHKSSDVVVFNKPRIFIFTNKAIDTTLFSKDRYKIWRINENYELVPHVFLEKKESF